MEHFIIKKKYLADALSYLGFKYYKYSNVDGISYSFEKTNSFVDALNELLKLKDKFNQYK